MKLAIPYICNIGGTALELWKCNEHISYHVTQIQEFPNMIITDRYKGKTILLIQITYIAKF